MEQSSRVFFPSVNQGISMTRQTGEKNKRSGEGGQHTWFGQSSSSSSYHHHRHLIIIIVQQHYHQHRHQHRRHHHH
jgi:hypothetical protein